MLTLNDVKTIAKLLGAIWLGMLFVVVMREIAGTLTLREWNYDPVADMENITSRLWLPWLAMSPVLAISQSAVRWSAAKGGSGARTGHRTVGAAGR